LTPALPPLLSGGRRGLMVRLVGASAVHAGCAVATAVLVGGLVGATSARILWLALAVGGALAGMGLTKYAERVLAERVGQDYVHELRGRLVTAALTGDGGPSLGITIARTTNDLASVRTWVAQGIGPLVAAVPLVLGSLVLLATLHWSIAVTTLVALLALGGVLGALSGTAYNRARTLRRRRGRLAARVTDTLQARPGIRASGGEQRELRRLHDESRSVAAAAVARARTAGTLQASAAAGGAGLAALAAVVGRLASVRPADVAVALTIAGVLASPLAEAGRIVAFRQNYRAARRIIAPQIADSSRPARRNAVSRVPSGAGTIQLAGLPGPDGPRRFSARRGDRVRVTGPDAGRVSDFLRRVAAPGPDDGLEVVIDGWAHSRLEPRRRRELVGLAAAGSPLERGTVARAARYRRPDLDATAATTVLERVGLDVVLATLEKGERTELRRGGEPLGPADRARLQLARGVLGDPPLLLLDRIDADLDQAGREVLRRVVAEYPGVVLFASDAPERVAGEYATLVLGQAT
jgi:ABC-type multidrug transport system fused ATPase/permease subunit